jgi:hypothetical protein
VARRRKPRPCKALSIIAKATTAKRCRAGNERRRYAAVEGLKLLPRALSAAALAVSLPRADTVMQASSLGDMLPMQVLAATL